MQSHESLSTFAVALVTGDWQEKDREMQVGDLCAYSACGFACFVLGYTHQARQGLVVVQILQWRQQQVRIHSRSDKSTRRNW
jgi:hypothetical protein